LQTNVYSSVNFSPDKTLCRRAADLLPGGALAAFEIAEEAEDRAIVHEREVIGQLRGFELAERGPEGGERGETVEAALADEQERVEEAGAANG